MGRNFRRTRFNQCRRNFSRIHPFKISSMLRGVAVASGSEVMVTPQWP
jgi:hypothetical protein